MENKTIYRDSLNESKEAEAYAIKLDTMYSLLISTPHFEDKNVEIEDWAINYFHKETKEEIEWTIATCLMLYINETGNKVSHVVTNPTLKNFCIVKIWLKDANHQDPQMIANIENLTKHGVMFKRHGES